MKNTSLKTADITVSENSEGALVLSALIGGKFGFLFTKRYLYLSKAAAIARFKADAARKLEGGMTI